MVITHMMILNKLFITLASTIAPIMLISCDDSKVSNNNKPLSTVKITDNLSFTSDRIGKQYIITQDNVTLDLGGHTIYADGEYAAIIVRASGVIIKNGTIKGAGFATGINIQSCVNLDDVDSLNNSPATHEPLIYERCNKGLIVDNIKFENLKTGVYISSYVSGSKIKNSDFKNIDRMAIYLDAGSKNTIIHHSTFIDIGYRDIENYGRPRGSISIDSSYANIISGNTFNSQPKFSKKLLNNYRIPELEFYRNCGEKSFGDTPLPRIHGADNNVVKNNTFKNVGLVAWFKYRDHDQIGSCVGNYPDQANNNSITGSTLENVEQFVIDEGKNNTW